MKNKNLPILKPAVIAGLEHRQEMFLAILQHIHGQQQIGEHVRAAVNVPRVILKRAEEATVKLLVLLPANGVLAFAPIPQKLQNVQMQAVNGILIPVLAAVVTPAVFRNQI